MWKLQHTNTGLIPSPAVMLEMKMIHFFIFIDTVCVKTISDTNYSKQGIFMS